MRPSFVCSAGVAFGLLVVSGARGQDIQPASVRASADLTRVHVDAPGDGNVWVLAPGYKARFGADGVDYFPYFGPKADRLYPVSFRVREVRRGARVLACTKDVPPRVAGDRVCFDRGGVLEVWDLRLAEVEQSFVLTDFAGAGDLIVHLDVRSELAASDVADGLRFAHPRWGHVHYGDVVAFDAAGQRCTSQSMLSGTGIELRVPATFVAAAHGALTVDPIVRSIGVDSGTTQTLNADVAFEPNTGTWLVAYAREFATTDSDIITRRFNSAGDFLDETVVATGNRESRNPAVGANGLARQFLIAWDEDTAVANRVILGRTRAAASTTQGATFTVQDTPGLGMDDFAPQVGGSIATDSTGGNYAVLCLSDNSSDRHASFVRVSTSGTATRLGTASQAGHEVADVRIARTRRNGESWIGAYLAVSGSARHVHGVQLDVDGLPIRSQPVDTNADCRLGGVAGRGSAYFVVYARAGATGGSDIFGAPLFVGLGFSSGPPINLTAREPGAVAALDQLAPTLAFDGCRYTYAYQEAAGAAGSFDLFAAVVSVPDLVFSDGHRPLHTASAARETAVTMASTGDMGGELARSFLVFDRLDNGDLDVAGVLFDGTAAAGGVTMLRTGCGNLDLAAQNQPILGATLELRATVIQPAAQIFLVGLATPPLRLCASMCALGVTPILFTALGATLSLPIPCRSNLVGAELAVQNVLVGGAGGCAPPATPLALVTSPTLVIAVR
jgi:hypothetical protein